MSTIVEIRAAEGGDDAKLLVRDQVSIYAKAFRRLNVHWEIVDDRPGIMVIKVNGRVPWLSKEQGGQRWQRVPPTERSGRKQSSTITVAVLGEFKKTMEISDSDIEFRCTVAGGPGGQHRQKNATAVIATYKPTGVTVRCESERSQHRNKEIATALLKAKILEGLNSASADKRNSHRAAQIGSGERSDKIRTVQVTNGHVINHLNGKRTSVERYMKGFIEDLH